MDYKRSRGILTFVFWAAVVVSVVHYTDNYFNHDEFPHGDGPEPSKP